MKTYVTSVRAIGTEFIQRLLRPIALILLVVFAVLLVASVLLTFYSHWWWILFAAVLFFGVAAAVLIATVFFIIRRISPRLSSHQKQSVKTFVDKLERLKEVSQTPWPLLVFRLLRDVVRPRQNGFVASLSDDTSTLKKDFQALSDSFR